MKTDTLPPRSPSAAAVPKPPAAVTLERREAERVQAAAQALCGLVRLLTATREDAREHALAPNSPVWGMLAEAETTLFHAQFSLTP